MTKKKQCKVLPIPKNESEAREARRIIARDALAWIKAGALKPAGGMYFCPTNIERFNRANIYSSQARDHNFGPTSVCALGAIFVAKAVRYNDVTVSDVLNSHYHSVTSNLSKFFGIEQLEKIEQAFEGWVFGWHKSRHDDAIDFCGPSFGENDPDFDPTARLNAILENIVEHGEFCP